MKDSESNRSHKVSVSKKKKSLFLYKKSKDGSLKSERLSNKETLLEGGYRNGPTSTKPNKSRVESTVGESLPKVLVVSFNQRDKDY